MKLAIMQPYLFPYIGYWQLFDTVDVFVIYDDVSYIKKGHINRNSILVNGQKHTFTLELIKASQNKNINQITIGNNSAKILKTIELNYKKALYFEDVFPLIENVFTQKENNLSRYIGFSINLVKNYLGINTQILYSSEIEKNNALSGQDKILEISKILDTQNYINPIGGQELYNREKFNNEAIKLNFIKNEIDEYKQFSKPFVSHLSIIDVLMFNSKGSVLNMLNSFKLI